MPTLSEIFDKRKILLYQNENLDLDHYYQEPYQDENDEIKEMGKPFETDESKKIRTIDLDNEDRTYSGFSFFMDGSRRTYKIGDIVLERKKIFPVVAAQIRAGCTERDRQKKLHTHGFIHRKNLLLLSDKMNEVDFQEIRQRILKTQMAQDLHLDIVKYYFDPVRDSVPVNAAIAKANSIMHVEFVYAEASDGQPLYIGWLALTDFSGIISDEAVQGIRFRKGNILIGNNTTFVKYFPSEGHNANRMFVGEIHVLHNDLIPNSQRDDFEPNAICSELRQSLGKWAGEINKKYRRGMSEATSALRRLKQLNLTQKELEEKINSGVITSDEKRDQIAEQLKQIEKKRETEEKIVRKAQERGTFGMERETAVEKVLAQTETASKKMTTLNKKVVNADYATKNDLPSSYSRGERKLYQRIIMVIDTFFKEDPQIAEKLREAIKLELSVKKK